MCLGLAPAAAAQDRDTATALVYAAAESAEREAARDRLRSGLSDEPVTRAEFAAFAAALRAAGRFAADAERVISVPIAGHPPLEVHVEPPPGYSGETPVPVILAFGGGPIPFGDSGDRAAARQAQRMVSVWREAAEDAGYLVAGVHDTVSRSRPGIRYEIVRPDHVEAVLLALRRRFNVDENRTFMTGISLGSNYSIACGAARPHLLCGAAPVSTEGDGRAPLLRNLRNFPLYVLEGVRDRNIRTIDGPRALHAILDRFGYDHVYEEYRERGHEGFQERYPAVLTWFASRPRNLWPKHVVRVPHTGIVSPDRRFYWIACDTRQGVFRAGVDGNTVSIDAARLTRIDLWLSDELLDLDAPVTVRVNGETVLERRVQREPMFAADAAHRLRDRHWLPAARVTIDLPDELVAGERAREFAARMTELDDDRPELAFWEFYALRHLRETRALLGITGAAVELTPSRVGLRVDRITDGSAAAKAGLRSGDVVAAFDGNPFFAGDEPRQLLDLWCLREEFGPGVIEVELRRDGEPRTVAVTPGRR